MNNRLYVGNLSFDTTEDRIQQAFAEFGEVTEVKLMLDRETGRSRGFAFVTMATAEDTQKALSQMNGTSLDGRSSASTKLKSVVRVVMAAAAVAGAAAAAAAAVAEQRRWRWRRRRWPRWPSGSLVVCR